MMDAGRELDALIALQIFRYTLDYEFADTLGAPCVRELRDQYDEWGMLPHYSTEIGDAWLVVEKMHAGIDPATMNRYQYLTLCCVSTYGAKWAASFDFNLGDEWYEADLIMSYPFAVRASTAPLAVCRAALAACGVPS